MKLHKAGFAAFAIATAGLIGLPIAATAHADIPADDASEIVYPQDPQATMDPNNPDYWDSGEHAGGTGAESQDNAPSYNNQDEPAGGTGEEANSDDFNYAHGSEDAGAI